MLLRVSKNNTGNRTVFPLFTNIGDWVIEYDADVIEMLLRNRSNNIVTIKRTLFTQSVPVQLWWNPTEQILDNYSKKHIQLSPLQVCKFFSDGSEDITETLTDKFKEPKVTPNSTCKEVAVKISDLLLDELQHIAGNNDDIVLFRTGGLDCAVLESIIDNYLINIKVDDSYYGDPFPAVTHYDHIGPQQKFLMAHDSNYMKLPPSSESILTGFFAEQTSLCWPPYMRAICHALDVDYMAMHIDAKSRDAYYPGYIEREGLLNSKKFPFTKISSYSDTCKQIEQSVTHTQPVFGYDGKLVYSPFNDRSILRHIMSLEKQELLKHFYNKEVWWEIIRLNSPSISETVVSPKPLL